MMMLLSGFFEVFSLASIIPFISILIAPEKINIIPFFSFILSFFQLNSNQEILNFFTFLFILAILTSGSIKLINLWLSNRLVASIGCDISCDAYYRTLYQPYKVHIQRNSASVISTTTTETSNTVAFLSSALQLSASFIISSFLIISLLILNFKVALISGLVFISSYLLIIFFIRRKLKVNSQVISNSNRSRVKALQEGLGGIRNVILERAQEFYTNLYRNSDYPLRIRESQNWFFGAAPRYILESIGLTFVALLGLILTSNPNNASEALPLLGAIAFGAQRLLPSLQMIYAQWASMKSQTKAVKNVLNLLEQSIPNSAFLKRNSSLKLRKNIQFKNVSFHYENEIKNVLKDFDVTFLKGEKIGIVGKTGSGKSTFLDILMGLIEPTKGNLYIDGIDIFNNKNYFHLIDWQKSISHVPQNIFLTDSTIEENIAFGLIKTEIDFREVRKAAKKAKIDQFINSLSNGYKTKVGERGVLLSGGQIQRIAIARSFYKSASIYVFDEATSALDEKTERLILESINKISKNSTVFMISHKPKALSICDRIFEISDFKINQIFLKDI